MELPRYPLPTPGLPFGQQAVSPVAQVNPLGMMADRIPQGFEMGIQAQQAQRQQEQLELMKREQENKDFMAFGSAVKNLHALPSRVKGDYWAKVVAPSASRIGLQVDPNWNADIDEQVTKDVVQMYEHHIKNPAQFTREDLMAGIQLSAAKAEQEGRQEQADLLREMSKDWRDTGISASSQMSLGMKDEQFNVNTAQKFGAALTGNQGVRKVMAINQQKLNNIQNAKALIDQVEAQPGGADRRQMFEIAAATMRTLMQNNMLTEGEINQLIPSTYKGNVNKYIEKLTNQPTGLDAQEFVNRYKDTLRREYGVTQKVMEDARGELMGQFETWAKENPQYSAPVLKSMNVYHPTLNPIVEERPNPFGETNAPAITEVKSLDEANKLPKGTRFRFKGRTGTVQ